VRFKLCVLGAISAWLAIPVGAGDVATNQSIVATQDAQQILAQLHFPMSVEVPFTQSQVNPLLRSVSRQRGVMFKSPHQGLMMRVTSPRREERTLHDGFITLHRDNSVHRTPGKRTITRRMKLNPQQPSHLALLALEALLYGDLALLSEHFHFAATAADTGWQLVLTPHAQDLRQKLTRLEFTGTDTRLTRFRSERDNAAGDTTHWMEVSIDSPQRP